MANHNGQPAETMDIIISKGLMETILGKKFPVKKDAKNGITIGRGKFKRLPYFPFCFLGDSNRLLRDR